MTVQDSGASPSDADVRSVLAELHAIVEAAIELQPEIESVMRTCLTPEPKDAALAHKSGQLSAMLAYLLDRADQLPQTWIVEEARGLLVYHHRLLAETVSRAYSVSAIFQRRPADKFSSHLGKPAARLRRLGDLLAGYLGNEGADTSVHRAVHVPPPGLLSHGLLSHSLRTPLTTVLGNASSLLQGDVTWDHDTRDRLLKAIVAESSRLARAVDNILHLASIEAGTLRPDFDWCEPAALLHTVIAGVDQALSPSDRVTLRLSLPDTSGPGGLIWADHVLLGHAVANVVDNALRHNPRSTRVTLAAAAERERLVVSVIDDGRALAPTVSTAIARAAANGELPIDIGTGIATTIGLVSTHGGTVTYSSGPDGTCCKITLPLDPTREPA
jgi:His Kinase A (phospho-acceptor) domain/Histidine kinase-, DNA gyrase B-, and HSP90-like ATPase